MKECKKINFAKRVATVFVLMMAFVLVASTQFTSYAATAKAKNKKALAAYEKLLSNPRYDWDGNGTGGYLTKEFRFCVVDVNKDGVKDLLLENYSASHASGYYKLLTYHKGKVKCVLSDENISVYKKRGVVSTSYASTGSYRVAYYKIKNGKAIEMAAGKATDTKKYAKPKVKHKVGKEPYATYYYSLTVKGKEVSYKKYKKTMKKLLKNAKGTDLIYYDNTAENRAAYIK